MRIMGFGMPDMLGLFAWLIGIGILVGLIVLIVVAVKQPARTNSTSAYQRIVQLDDLRKRGAISEEEYQQRKNDVIRDL